MTAPKRLPAPFGRLIDRSRTHTFNFEGRTYSGLAGDTLASALAANDVRLLSRSFKYHRPRGVFSMAGHEANSFVQLPDEPNVSADRLALHDGLSARAVNVFGSLERDFGAVLDRLSGLLPVGFYYHTFFRPRALWPFWEKVIRRLAGLGDVPSNQAHLYFDKAYAFCDVAVIGAGPAGLSAALEAAAQGARVTLIDENPWLGGGLAFDRLAVDSDPAERQLADLLARVANEPRITVMADATCQGLFADNWLPVTRSNRLIKLRAKAVVLATGAIGQPAVFADNDRPGIMLASAARRLIRLYGVKPGERAVVLAANDEAYGTVLDLLDAGVSVAAVLDLRADAGSSELVAAVAKRGVALHPGVGILQARTKGGRLSAVVPAPVGDTKPMAPIACDLCCVSVGTVPNAALLYHAGGRVVFDQDTGGFSPVSVPPHLFLAGSVAGAASLAMICAQGRLAGFEAALDAGLEATSAKPTLPASDDPYGTHAWPVMRGGRGKAFVDFDEDLKAEDIENAVAAGFAHVQLLKRYSTAGMGPTQGKTANPAVFRLIAKATGQSLEAVGNTTVRPPFGGEKIGHLAGRSFDPVRRSAMHTRHLELGAQMMPAGQWLRPAYYGPEQAAEAAIAAEVQAVREGVGLIDVSTLGGLEIRGPGAAEFMNRIYTFAYKAQPVGRSRYVLMCNEAGHVIDDGVSVRLADQHFYVTATTSGVDAVYRTMQWFNAQWRLKVDIANVTAAYAGINLAGPKARQVLAAAGTDIDLSAEAFPYLEAREGHVAGIAVRAIRVGFVGELGYELHCAAGLGEALWDALMAAGREFAIRPFGVEAQRVLRLEKGHVIIGQDTDGLTTPYEANMGWAVSVKKPAFVGKQALAAMKAETVSRLLVGFRLEDPNGPTPKECHLVIRDGDIAGRVTSVARSQACGGVIGLAFVEPDQAANGTTIRIRVDGGVMVSAQVVPTPFFDPDGKRQEL